MSTRTKAILAALAVFAIIVAAHYHACSDAHREARQRRYEDRADFVQGVRRWWRSTEP